MFQLYQHEIFFPFNIIEIYLYFILANWEDIKYEISCSNVIQRDNVLFAKKLDKALVEMAKEGDKEVIN